MTKIFIEAEDKTTPEYNFLKAFIDMHFPTKDIDFICIGGIGNLLMKQISIRFLKLKLLENKCLF